MGLAISTMAYPVILADHTHIVDGTLIQAVLDRDIFGPILSGGSAAVHEPVFA